MNVSTPEQIKHLRKSLKLTQKAFGEMIGTTREYVNLLEKGVRSPGKTLCILLNCMEKKMEKESDENGKHISKR